MAETARRAADTVTLDQARVSRLSRMDALSRIKEGEYGYCVKCGEAIVLSRLQINPAAPLRIKCAGRGEQAYP